MKKLIRIVDDDEGVVQSLKSLLELEGYEVHSWSDPKQFLAEDSPSVPGCILLDVMMPSMNGYDVQKTLLERSIYLPIIFVTAFGELEAAVNSMKLGATDFLQKPLDPEAVLRSVKKALMDQMVKAHYGISKPEAMKRFSALTEREAEILNKAYIGLSNSEIAAQLLISFRTVETHRAKAYRKLGVNSQEEMKALLKLVYELQQELKEQA